MKNQTRSQLRIACVVGMLFFLCLLLFASMLEILWVGRADLTVEFVVTDTETGEPIPGVGISILSSGSLKQDGSRLRSAGIEEEQLKLTTDATGAASYVCRGSMAFGRASKLPFRNTYCVHLPQWRVTIAATGYATAEPFHIDELPNRQTVKRVGPQQAKLVVPITLRKSP